MAALVGPGAEGIGLLHGHANIHGFVLTIASSMRSPRRRYAPPRLRCGSGAVARRADEGADLVGILLARRALDPGGHIDAAARGDAQGLGDIAGIETAREHERHAGIEILQQLPVERLAEAAGPRRLARCAGIEQQTIGDGGIVATAGEVGRGLDRDRLHHRQAEARLQAATRAGVSLP